MNGPILEHYQEKGETVDSTRYSTIQEEKLKPAIHSHCRRLLSKGVLLLHDNAQQHTAAATVTSIQKLEFETINHPLAVQTLLHLSCVWHAEENIARMKTSQQQQGEGDGAFLALTTAETFFSTGIHKLVKRCEKLIARDSDCLVK
jgi:hypothetical protein